MLAFHALSHLQVASGWAEKCHLAKMHGMPGTKAMNAPADDRYRHMSAAPSPNPARYWLWAILLLAVAVRIYGNWWDFPAVHHPDESKLVHTALEMHANRTPFTWFLAYPTLYTYVLVVVFGIGDAVGRLSGLWASHGDALLELYYLSPAPFHLAARSLTALMGALTVLLTWQVTARLFSPRAGLVAALFLAFAYNHVIHSHYATTDVPASLMVMLCLYTALPVFYGSRRWQAYALCGLMVGFAAATKYPAALAGVFLLVAHWSPLPRPPRYGISAPKRSCRLLLLALATAAVGFALACPSALYHPGLFVLALIDESIHSRTGHLGTIPGTFAGYFTQLTPAGGVGWPLTVAALFGLIAGLRLWPRPTVLAMSLPVVYYALIGSSFLQMDRYFTPLVPFMCLAAAVFVEALGGRLFEPRKARHAWLLVALLLTAQPAFYGVLASRLAVAQVNSRKAAADWVLAHVPADEKVLVGAHHRDLPRERSCIMEETYNDMLPGRYRLLLELLKRADGWEMLRSRYGEPLDAQVRRYEQRVAETPTIADSRAVPLDVYHAQGCRWMIVAEESVQRFYQEATVATWPQMTRSWQQFYEQVARDGELVLRVSPGVAQHPWGREMMHYGQYDVYRVADAGG